MENAITEFTFFGCYCVRNSVYILIIVQNITIGDECLGTRKESKFSGGVKF
jgi:hypothetical protein